MGAYQRTCPTSTSPIFQSASECSIVASTSCFKVTGRREWEAARFLGDVRQTVEMCVTETLTRPLPPGLPPPLPNGEF